MKEKTIEELEKLRDQALNRAIDQASDPDTKAKAWEEYEDLRRELWFMNHPLWA